MNVHSNLLLSNKIIEIINPTIPNGRFIINIFKYSFKEETPNNPGTTSITPNHPDVKFINIEAMTSNAAFLEKSILEIILLIIFIVVLYIFRINNLAVKGSVIHLFLKLLPI
ncbi:hypothetical protein HYT32_01485 [Candidatus Roizmanbacteria bacterium]|nr:hypothetical protein [Candidatus Roizmanbacteria bacterium]